MTHATPTTSMEVEQWDAEAIQQAATVLLGRPVGSQEARDALEVLRGSMPTPPATEATRGEMVRTAQAAPEAPLLSGSGKVRVGEGVVNVDTSQDPDVKDAESEIQFAKVTAIFNEADSEWLDFDTDGYQSHVEANPCASDGDGTDTAHTLILKATHSPATATVGFRSIAVGDVVSFAASDLEEEVPGRADVLLDGAVLAHAGADGALLSAGTGAASSGNASLGDWLHVDIYLKVTGNVTREAIDDRDFRNRMVVAGVLRIGEPTEELRDRNVVGVEVDWNDANGGWVAQPASQPMQAHTFCYIPCPAALDLCKASGEGYTVTFDVGTDGKLYWEVTDYDGETAPDPAAVRLSMVLTPRKDEPQIEMDAIAVAGVDEGEEATCTPTWEGGTTPYELVISWGDGTTDTYSSATSGTARTHTYTTCTEAVTHDYTVKATVRDATLTAASQSTTCTVTNLGPSAVSGTLVDDTITVGDTATLTVNFTAGYAGDTHQVKLYIEPLTLILTVEDVDDGDQIVIPASTWQQPYTGGIGIKVTDDDGAYDAAASPPTITVSNATPVLSAIANQTVEDDPTITVAWTDPGTDTHTVEVDWGDGEGYVDYGTQTSPFVVSKSTAPGIGPYTMGGTYNCTARVTDSHAASDTTTFTITATVLGVTAGDVSVVIGQPVNMPITFSGGTGPYRLEIDVDVYEGFEVDPAVSPVTWGESSNSFGVGVWAATVRVYDSASHTATAYATITITES
jgi:hypothetical protein